MFNKIFVLFATFNLINPLNYLSVVLTTPTGEVFEDVRHEESSVLDLNSKLSIDDIEATITSKVKQEKGDVIDTLEKRGGFINDGQGSPLF